MRHRARLLHILASAPVTVLMAVSVAPVAHAQDQVQSPAGRPTPYVVAIDAGHGGTPDNSHPEVPFDPGVIGPTGLLEKDVTLDLAQQVRRLLVADHVAVVMTRSTDRYVTIGGREQAAVDGRASLFVSIHMNSFGDAATGGTTVLYPTDASAPFARVMSDAVGQQLAQFHLGNDGIQLKDDLWVHATMPAVTVECAYLSNPGEESLMRQQPVRALVARGIVAGVERQSPDILRLKRSIAAWDAAHPPGTGVGGAASAAVAQLPRLAESGGHGVRNLALFVLALLVWWRRRVVAPLSWRLTRWSWRTGGMGIHAILARTRRLNSRRSARERRRQRLNRGRREALLERSNRRAPRRQTASNRTSYQSVYDELRL